MKFYFSQQRPSRCEILFEIFRSYLLSIWQRRLGDDRGPEETVFTVACECIVLGETLDIFHIFELQHKNSAFNNSLPPSLYETRGFQIFTWPSVPFIPSSLKNTGLSKVHHLNLKSVLLRGRSSEWSNKNFYFRLSYCAICGFQVLVSWCLLLFPDLRTKPEIYVQTKNYKYRICERLRKRERWCWKTGIIGTIA